ncbi:MAG: hypothetical protein JXQ71_11590, partial [Verrucomicrobia bacterium]|nr:hypothetical protein [Verrucomicrobiota bacterium]
MDQGFSGIAPEIGPGLARLSGTSRVKWLMIRAMEFRTLNAQRSTLNVQRSTFNVQRSTLNAQRSTLNAQRSTLNA